MRKFFLALMVSLVAVCYDAIACTNFIVGKDASADGSVMCTYNADDYGMFMNLCHYPAGRHQKGEKLKIYDWDTGEYHGEIDQAEVTYNVIGNINEYQLTIAETTYGGREEMVDESSILDYGSLIYIALQRAKTAREAIDVMTSLVEKYGYCSEGETFSICDPNEAWIMEMMGKGPGGHGAVWVAVRIPDNAICAHANQSRIRQFMKMDKKSVRYSKDVVAFARKMGWYDGKDADFDWQATYAFADFEGRRFCDARVWSFFRHFDKGMDRYLPWALGKDPDAEQIPLYIIPDHKATVAEIQNCMRDHYEGTPLSLDQDGDAGRGVWNMPYRPTPLSYKVDGKKYFNERPTSTQQSAFTFVAQMRSWLPRQIGGVLWFGNDDANMVAYTPFYCGNTVRPECYNTPGADAVTFSDKNAYWVCNWVSNMTYPRYEQIFPSVKVVRDSLESVYHSEQAEVDAKAQELYRQNEAAAIEYLNQYSCQRAQEMLARWRQLAVYIIVKYNDMAVKPDTLGQFKRTATGLGERVKRPGYPERVARDIIRSTGDRYAYPGQ